MSEKKKNYVILIGGSEDRKRDKVILNRMLKKTRAKHIAIIPSASFYPIEASREYKNAFNDLGVKNVDTLDIRYRDEADRQEHLEIVESADLVFFSGGDQVKLVRTLNNSDLIRVIKRRFEEENLSIAGSSAGAAAASRVMYYDGDYHGFEKNSINDSEGFGFLEDITIDTHFRERQRYMRMVQILASGKTEKGIGLDEDTAIIIRPGQRFEVVGSGIVTVMDGRRIKYSNYEMISEHDLIGVDDIKMSFLTSGMSFSMKRWKANIPMRQKNIIKQYLENKKRTDTN